ncbi:hypothetical protein KAB67_000752 [Salmonella enterica]|nr:hypothetical protein [Salmonella enterica]
MLEQFLICKNTPSKMLVNIDISQQSVGELLPVDTGSAGLTFSRTGTVGRVVNGPAGKGFEFTGAGQLVASKIVSFSGDDYRIRMVYCHPGENSLGIIFSTGYTYHLYSQQPGISYQPYVCDNGCSSVFSLWTGNGWGTVYAAKSPAHHQQGMWQDVTIEKTGRHIRQTVINAAGTFITDFTANLSNGSDGVLRLGGMQETREPGFSWAGFLKLFTIETLTL